MATPANIGVNNHKNVLTFDRTSSDLKDLKDRNFSFTIVDAGDGQSQAEFQIADNNGQVLRKNVSKPFPAGAIQKKSAKLTKDAYVVEVKKQSNITLDDYF
uniref:Uncharacterized protein n=1 Tax=Arion vulgaris TaxID=1028688 RepID=A0A0B7AX77_9EUPU